MLGANANLLQLTAAAAALTFTAMACSDPSAGSTVLPDSDSGQGELIVLAAPASDDGYYSERRDEIAAFQIEFAQRIMAAGDDVLVLADGGSVAAFEESLGAGPVLRAPQLDIWMRDFGTANAVAPALFGYTAEGQGGGRSGQDEADFVQERLFELIEQAGIEHTELDLLNDGGNFVEDGAGMAVLSRKFLRDNALSESEARRLLKQSLGLRHIAFIEADEQGGLEHSDGVVAFVEPGVLVINSYPDDPDYARELRRDLEAGLPGVELHQIVTPYDGSSIFDERFGSACGLYTNMLVTPQRIYLPQFGIPEDEQAVETVQALTDKSIVPVPSGAICQMGGGVRCMSWQLRGSAAANLLAYARGN